MKRGPTLNDCLRKAIAYTRARGATLEQAIAFMTGYAERNHPMHAKLLDELVKETGRWGLCIRTSWKETYSADNTPPTPEKSSNG